MKVYFNNSCKICKAEIDLYKKEKIQEIDWVDITANELAVKETSKDSKELLRRLHVKEGEKVKERQKIAEMGRSKGGIGRLHFEIRKKGRPIDPLKFLFRH